MLKWKKIEAGEYTDTTKRFHILKTWNRIYGNHWQLRDRNEPDYYKSIYNEQTLMECKLKAEALISASERKCSTK